MSDSSVPSSGSSSSTLTASSSTPTSISVPSSSSTTPIATGTIILPSSTTGSTTTGTTLPPGTSSTSASQSFSTTSASESTTPTPPSTVRGKTSPITFSTTINATTTGPTAIAFTGFVDVRPIQKSGLSGGAAAGIAIATLIIGAAIAAIAMLVLQRKKKRKSKTSRSSAYANSASGHGPAESLSDRSKEKAVVSADATDPEYLLPQPRDDQSMGAAANQLFVHIGNHVENFYHNESVRDSIKPRSEEDELLISRKTRFFAIKKHICHEMLAAIAWECPPEHSLLPAAAVSMAQTMSRGNLDEKTYEVAWSRWRVSTSLLLKPEDPKLKTPALEFWLDRLRTHLKPFQVDSPEMREKMQQDLHAICKLAENLASLMCSQPAKWEFHWPRSEGRTHFVIFPEFLRTTDSKARRLDRPRRVLEAHKMQ